MPARKNNTAKRSSGAVGGPSTARGMNYQIDYGVLHALDLIALALCLPHRKAALSIEPREVSGSAVTAWDLAIRPPAALVEAKLNPSRNDILEWLDRIALRGKDAAKTEFRLVHSTGGGKILNSVRQLLRIAKECGNDQEKFTNLIALEEVQEADEILKRLGPASLDLLRRMAVENVPEGVLETYLRFRLRILAGESGGQRLREFLFHKLSNASPHRAEFDINALISEIQELGIALHVSSEVSLTGLAPEAEATLIVLQACPSGLPLEVLAEAQKLSPAEFALHSAPLVDGKLVVVEDGLYRLIPLPVTFTRPDRSELLANTLSALVEHIRRSGRTGSSYSDLLNAVALAKKCFTSHPEVVARVFLNLDKHLKDLGDKHLVLEVADLSIGSARRTHTRTSQVVEGEAHALICGRSWVLQRVGRLEEAKVEAEKSLKLGEDIGWDRNTAFCHKCIGRLNRLQAEQAESSDEKRRLFSESRLNIQEAIHRFSQLSGFGPNDPAVGDCYSLLGRTHLVAGEFAEAGKMIRKAYELITPLDRKDYADLLILDGDFHVANKDRTAADGLYSDALAAGSEEISDASEIRARAYFQRGKNRVAMRMKDPGIADLRSARALWEKLGEQEAAAQASWDEISASTALSDTLRTMLLRERPAVRVKAVRAYEAALARVARRGPRREEPAPAYLDRVIEDARKEVAIEAREW
jgi:tetratricopeptide (TPR) repeat protein